MRKAVRYELPILEKAQTEFCKDCIHFVVEDDIDGPAIPWCGNLETKKLDHPIGFLNTNAKACALFEGPGGRDLTTIRIGESITQANESARKEHWSLTMIKICLCSGVVKFLITGQDAMAFKMALFVVVLSAIGFAKEVSADFVKGSLRLSR